MAGVQLDLKMSPPRCFAFVFPMASGHINPSLPIARSLVELGHEVHYLCVEQMCGAVEDTGAVFHSVIEEEPELYDSHEADLLGADESLKRALGLRPGSVTDWYMVKNIMLEMQLPGILRFFQRIAPSAVVYCPLLNREAAAAALVLGIPAVALQTTAGPGSILQFFEYTAEMEHTTVDEWDARLRSYEPHVAATQRLNERYGLRLEPGLLRPIGRLDGVAMASKLLVTTSEDLKDPAPPELERAMEDIDGTKVIAVGPLLDRPGAKRAGGHRTNAGSGEAEVQAGDHGCEVLARVRAARQEGRPVVLVSMGTVITGDHPKFGWAGRERAPDGRPCGLTGRELCRAAWRGAFDACGEGADRGPLIVLALGPQPEPLEGLSVPPNAACAPVVPQVDILKAGVEAFVTHGGQNSFTEALAHSTPVVVCPGAGDQVVNGQKAENLGVGLCVPRPEPIPGTEAQASESYRAAVRCALQRVRTEASFALAAAACAGRLERAGGVAGAVEEVLSMVLPGAPLAAAAGA